MHGSLKAANPVPVDTRHPISVSPDTPLESPPYVLPSRASAPQLTTSPELRIAAKA